jgi:two-component system cell cycle sensor histidine kinase/response regulator CckA
LVRDPLVHGRVADDVATIGKAAERAARLTRQLLAFSRKQVLQPKVVDLNQIVGSMRELIQSVTGEAVHLSLELSDGLGAVRVDRGQIEQCVTNLVMNACDALSAGGRVTVETSDVDVDPAGPPVETPPLPPGRYVCVTVSDDGVGIAPAVRNRLFEPFFTTKGKDRASGLGLAVVHGIVTQHGGHVRVESEPGHGASFKIYLPRVSSPTPSAAVAPARRPAEKGPAPAASVLLVEDDDDLRTLLCRALRQRGYTVIDAPDGPSALLLVRQRDIPLDVLVSDVIMPGGMSGLDLAKSAVSERPDIKVVLMSGHPRSGPSGEDIEPLSMSYLDKPFTVDVLAAKVREVLALPQPSGTSKE